MLKIVGVKLYSSARSSAYTTYAATLAARLPPLAATFAVRPPTRGFAKLLPAWNQSST